MGASQAGQSLQAVGVGPGDEALYRVLVEQPGSTADQLARAARVGAGTVRRAMSRLEDLGLVNRAATVPRRYQPTLPDAAIETLLHGREQAFERARMAAAELTDLYRDAMSRARPAGLVEVVSGREAVARRFLQLQKGARESLDVFDAPPYVTPANTAQPEALVRGVRYRSVYAAAALAAPERLDAVLRLVATGEQARVLPSVPMKLAMADRSLALLPMSRDSDRLGESAVVVHASPLLEALATLFELLWEQAVPVGAGRSPEDAAAGGPDRGDERVLALLTAGCKDEAIARQLGTSPRTVRRRVRRLMERLGAQTRFQAGLQAARRGWV